MGEHRGDMEIAQSVREGTFGKNGNLVIISNASKSTGMDFYIKKFKLRKFDSNSSFLHNYLSALENLSFLISYSSFMENKIIYNSNFFGLSKSINVEKTFIPNFNEKFYGYGACLDLIVIILNNLKKQNLDMFEKSDLSNIFVSNFTEMKKQFGVCEKIYRDCITFKLNPSRGNIKSSLVEFNLEFLKLVKLFENLSIEYNFMNKALIGIRELHNESSENDIKKAA
jgi:hypothetical protein